MKLNVAVAIGAILASSSCASTVEGMGRPQILMCMERTSDPSSVIDRAQTLTTLMFDQIGVALVWRGALAVSYPFEGVHIRVFYDRVRTVTECCPLPVVLAHVLAHEIGHIFAGERPAFG